MKDQANAKSSQRNTPTLNRMREIGNAQPRVKSWRRWLPNLMVVIGFLALPLVIYNMLATEQKYNSPFDQIDNEESSSEGFLPVLQMQPSELLQEALNAGNPAPTVEPTLSLQGNFAPTLEAAPPPENAGPPDLEANPGLPPEHLLIPVIDLYVPVVLAGYRVIDYEGQAYLQWEAPVGKVAGWQVTSAGLGVPGNTVLYGHHNIDGKVFENLYKVRVGQVIQLKSGDQLFTYRVVYADILEEKYQPLEVRLENARWLLPSTDERVTLVTCWPATSNTHRVIVVAVRDEPGG